MNFNIVFINIAALAMSVISYAKYKDQISFQFLMILCLSFILEGLNSYLLYNSKSGFFSSQRRFIPKFANRCIVTLFLFENKQDIYNQVIILWLLVEIAHFMSQYLGLFGDLLVLLWPVQGYYELTLWQGSKYFLYALPFYAQFYFDAMKDYMEYKNKK